MSVLANRQLVAWVAGTLAACVALFAVVDLPFRYVQGHQQQRIDRYERDLGITPAASARLSRVYEEVVALRAEVNGAQKRVPEADEIAEVIRGVTKAMELHAANQPVLTTGPTEHYATHSLIPIQIKFEADFMNAYRVLESLRSLPRLIRIERMSLSREDHELGEPMPVELDVAAFFSRPEQYAAADETGDRP